MSPLEKYLPRFAASCERLDADRWRVALSNGHPFPVDAHLDQGLLLLDTAAGIDLTAQNLPGLAALPPDFPPSIKLALRGGSSGVRLRAELPLPEDAEAAAYRIRGGLDGMRIAMHRLHDGVSLEPAGRATSGNLAELLKESGWPYHERSGGELTADLETAPEFLQAAIRPYDGVVCFSVTLYRRERACPAAQQALCLYLLEANFRLRCVRGFLQRSDQEIVAGFEICQENPSAGEASQALAALSVAGAHCARVLRVLDGVLAGIYRSARPPFYQSKGA